ncbi:MAG: type II secretion system F family protein [Actinomycetota bacterium]
MMVVPMALGALVGVGLWCILRAFVQPPMPLPVALDRLSRPREEPAAADLDSWAQRLGAWVLHLTNSDLRTLATDLAVLDRSEEVHLVQRIRTAGFYALVPGLIWFVSWSFSTSVFPPWLVVVAGLAGGVGGWFGTDLQVRARAAQRRREFDAALVTYLSLVSILLSGGAGVQEALHAAVDQGRGWPFVVLRRALTDARIRGRSPWQALDEHGDRLGLERLVDLAATMELAGTSGAHVRDSLITRAKAIRHHEAAEIEREATGRTTAMVGPTGLMMTGFVVLIIYPAFQAVLDL